MDTIKGINFRTQGDLYDQTVGKGFNYVGHIYNNDNRRGYAFDLCVWICAQEYQNGTTPKQPVYTDYGITEKEAINIEKTLRSRVGEGAVR
jgi:hypothetical protein